jgi:hypothetical protein
MDNRTDTKRLRAAVSDTELLRTIGQDLRAHYAEIIQRPLPRNIETTLARIEREQGLADVQSWPGTAFGSTWRHG